MRSYTQFSLSLNLLSFGMVLLILMSLLILNACDTGFGEPCTLPAGDAIQEACSSPAVEEVSETGTSQSASATCALDNFPGCSTFLCLKYRGSNPYCSMRCQTNSDCGGGVLPLGRRAPKTQVSNKISRGLRKTRPSEAHALSVVR